AIKHRNVACSEKDAVLNLLAVEFVPTDAPAGQVKLTFSGGCAMRLDVECLECELTDLGPEWATAACPPHVVEGEAIKTAWLIASLRFRQSGLTRIPARAIEPEQRVRHADPPRHA